MRSMTDLRLVAGDAKIDTTGMSRGQIMDAIRDKTGTFDPNLQIDPMKAQDLKREIDWTLTGSERFAGHTLSQYMQPSKYTLEPKIDGVRVRLFLGAESNSLNTGRRSDTTYAYIERADNFPHLRDTVNPALAGTIIDCELVMAEPVEIAPGDFTKGTLNAAMAVLSCNPAMGVARQEKHGKAILIAFDVLAVQGSGCMDKTLKERRELLTVVVKALGCPQVQLIPQFDATPQNVQQCLDAGFEGAMVKRINSPYLPGKRSADWMKIKKMSTGDFFIVGSKPGKGRNEGKVGSLKVAYRNGGVDVPVADVRGFDDKMCDALTDPETGEVKQEFINRVVEIMGQGRTKNERIRHPHFVRWREDKTPMDCDRTQLELFEEV